MKLKFKRGDTFDSSGQVTVKRYDGQEVGDLTGWTGASQVRDDQYALIDDLTFEWIDAAQRKCRIKSGDTSEWPVGRAFIDIEFTAPAPEGTVISTDTTEFEIIWGPTGGGT